MDPRTVFPGTSCRRDAAPSDTSCWGARVFAVVLTVLLVSSGVGAAAEFPALQTGDVETDTVVLEAAVDEDGDARWSIEYRVALDDQNTTEAFESLQQDIERNTSDYRGQFASRMESTVAAAENATGREMAVENVTVEAQTSPLSGEYGIVRYGFDWVAFAEVSDGQIAAGDALAGLFLDADTELTISWPEGYVTNVVEPEPDREGENSVTWTGPREFDVGQPRVVVRPAGGTPPLGAIVGIVLFAAAGIVWYYRRQQAARAREASEGGAPGSGASGSDAPTDAEADSDGTPAAVGGATDEPQAADDTSEELLSPEERVMRLLERNGGRMKQKAVTEELDWSAARTSQVVSDLRDEGEVESFRLGRENVLKFPDDEDDPPPSGR
ncbi:MULTISPECIES: helix-turn-helix transcriptional regulator [Halolamina]|uniref:Uncharacterized protein n=1 Tax=Halolamina pelagica TaxID=699431 RepID=A0A1I5SKB1_9EURY|nr:MULTISPECIES: hypothetical protein [Halolamina]NHX37019.1 hypothetical protein [Halolamina sp. R1-12]SFP71175.1 hypothetical protein SAMN05216277_106159 [Halolamina pelagica]